MRQCRLTASLTLVVTLLWSPSSHSADPLDEVVVTARKIPEHLHGVPLSVQALSGSRLEQWNLTSLYDIQFDVPGLVLANRGMFGAGLALRGVSDEGGGTLAIAPHVNGVPLGRSNLALARAFDVERIEIVKGPQGTLYGRNSTGGTINVVTRTPAPEFGAGIEGATGSFDTARVKGHLNLPAKHGAARLAFAASEGEGFIRNSIDARRFAAEDYRAVRAAVRVQREEVLAVDLMLQRVRDDGASTELWSPRPDFLPNPRDTRLTTVVLADPFLERTDDVATMDVSYRLAGTTFRSVTGYARNVTRAVDDCAGLPPLRGCVRSVLPLRFAQWSQEVRLESRSTTTDWVLGAFFFDSDEVSRFRFVAPRLAPSVINDSHATSSERAAAVFGQATVPLAQGWRATAGVRFSREERSVANVGTGLADPRDRVAASRSASDPSWRIGVEYRPADGLLWFASAATGFKPGGVTTERLPDGSFDRFDAERLTAYEFGVSASWPASAATLRASAFRYDYDGMQVRATRLIGNQVATDIDNAADARIQGLDVSGALSPTPHLALSGAFVWLPKAEFARYVDALTGALLTGNRVSRAPVWSASASARHRTSVPGLGSLSVSVEYNYRSRFYFSKENDPLLAQRGYGLLNVGLRLEPSAGRWYGFASARNVLGQEYFDQILLQSSPGEPARYEVGAGWRF